MSNSIRKIAMCPASELANGAILKVEVPDRPPLAVCNVEGEFFVIDDICTHGEASLSEGEMFGEDIVCPFHSGTFCVRTGEATGYPAEKPVRIYRSMVEDGMVFAEIPAQV